MFLPIQYFKQHLIPLALFHDPNAERTRILCDALPRAGRARFLVRPARGSRLGPAAASIPPGQRSRRLKSLSLEVDELFKHSIGYGDDTAVCLVSALGGYHIGELPGEIHVGELQCAAYQLAGAVAAGLG